MVINVYGQTSQVQVVENVFLHKASFGAGGSGDTASNPIKRVQRYGGVDTCTKDAGTSWSAGFVPTDADDKWSVRYVSILAP